MFFLVRTITETTKKRYFTLPNQAGWRSDDFIENHNPAKQNHQIRQNIAADYWSLVHFAVAQLLSSGIERNALHGYATYFSYRLHRGLISFFFLLAIVGTLLPIFGIAYLPQFRLIIGGCAILWGITAIVLHVRRLHRLILWERHCIGRPFLHCPVFELDTTRRDHPEWKPVDGDCLDDAIRCYGLDSATVMQILLGIMLVALLALLQLVDKYP